MSTGFPYYFPPLLSAKCMITCHDISLGDTPNLMAKDPHRIGRRQDLKTSSFHDLDLLSPFPTFPFRLRPCSQVLPYHSSLPSLLRSTLSTSQPFSKISVFEDHFSLHTMLCDLSPAGSTTLEFVFFPFSSSSYFLLVEYLFCTAFSVAYKNPCV